MSKVLVTESYLSQIANAIRSKLGGSTEYRPGDMANAIESIPTGGITPTGTKNISQNGLHDVTEYASANVNVQPNLQSKTVTENGTVMPDQGYDGLSSVVVNVSGGGGALNWRDTLSVNWDFSNPVNTRGQSSYSGSSLIYTLDGWQLQGGILTFVQGGIKLSRFAAGTAGFFMQRLKQAMTTAIVGRTITLSAMVDGVVNSATASPVPSASGDSGFAVNCNGVIFRGYGYGTEIAITIDIASDTDEHVIQAIKLEAGSNQTLATQVNGVWVLNNSMDANTEYIKARNGTVYNS